MKSVDRKLRVFLCHASQDKPVVRSLYKLLSAEAWVDPWLDEEKLLPGQDWNLEIEKAAEASDAVIVCLSGRSVSREGYVQREIKKVLDIASEKPEGTVFIIPLRMDECELPRSMRMYQALDYFPESELESSLRRLLRGLKARAESLRGNIAVGIKTNIGDAEKGLRATPPSQPVKDPHTKSSGAYSILFLAADPTDATRLRLGEELREIQEKLQLSKQRDRFKLEQRMSVRPADISQSLLDVQPQIVHFSGHGMASGELCFEDASGRLLPIRPDALAALFEQFSSQVNCVILNACFSETQAEAIRSHIDYVIGMNKAVGDRAAIAFAIGFYQALGAGRSISDAYKLGCVQIRLHGIEEHLTPVLLKRDDANDAEINRFNQVKSTNGNVQPRHFELDSLSGWDEKWLEKHHSNAQSGMKRNKFVGFVEVKFNLLNQKLNISQKDLLSAARKAQIHIFGWPIGIVSETPDGSPKPQADGIKAEIEFKFPKPDGLITSYDYWTLRNNGDFYLMKSLFEDGEQRWVRDTVIAFDTRIHRTTEILLYCQRLYDSLGVDPSAMVMVSIKHGGLKDRQLSATKADRRLFSRGNLACTESETEKTIRVRLSDIKTNLVSLVKEITQPLFLLFDFQEFADSIYEDIVNNYAEGKVV